MALYIDGKEVLTGVVMRGAWTIIDNNASALTFNAGAGGVSLLGFDTSDDAEILTVLRGLPYKRFHNTITLNTSGAETNVGLTPSAVIFSAAIRVSTQIADLDANNHTINLGITGTIAKYCSVAEGSSQTYISVNKKAKYTFDPTTDTESTALKLTIDVGSDKTPSAGAVEVEVIYLDSTDLANV